MGNTRIMYVELHKISSKLKKEKELKLFRTVVLCYDSSERNCEVYPNRFGRGTVKGRPESNKE
jgi:hypothetical protein